MAAVIGILIIFGMAPVTGDRFQTSLLTVEDAANFAETDPSYAKKILLDEVKRFSSECKRFKLSQCASAGEALLTDMVNPNLSEDVKGMVRLVSDFEVKYLQALADKSCEFDISNSLVQIKAGKKQLDFVGKEYGEVLGPAGLTENLTRLEDVLADLDGFVESRCRR